MIRIMRFYWIIFCEYGAKLDFCQGFLIQTIILLPYDQDRTY